VAIGSDKKDNGIKDLSQRPPGAGDGIMQPSSPFHIIAMVDSSI